jgi:hypothetical protein
MIGGVYAGFFRRAELRVSLCFFLSQARRPMGDGSIRALRAHFQPSHLKCYGGQAPRAGLFNSLVLSVLRGKAEQNVSKDANSILASFRFIFF